MLLTKPRGRMRFSTRPGKAWESKEHSLSLISLELYDRSCNLVAFGALFFFSVPFNKPPM